MEKLDGTQRVYGFDNLTFTTPNKQYLFEYCESNDTFLVKENQTKNKAKPKYVPIGHLIFQKLNKN